MKTPKKRKPDDPGKAKAIADQAMEIAQWAATALVASEQLGLKNRPLQHFYLSPAQREVLLLVPGVSKPIQTKLAKEGASFTAAEVGGMMMAMAEEMSKSEDRRRLTLLIVVQHLIERLKVGIAGPITPKMEDNIKEPKTSSTKLFQFKITLQGIEAPIWRRIQTKDCTLDKLHEHIQTAMGWTNSHLHQFKIGGVIYGDPQLLYDPVEDEQPPVNSLRTKVSKIVPKDGKRICFEYEYDFGDGWEHEILFEGFLTTEKAVRYPFCIEGERACPPEDVGGIRGYQEYVRAMANPKHKRHKELTGWRGPFDPEKFDAQAATKEMRKGVPDWRNAGPL